MGGAAGAVAPPRGRGRQRRAGTRALPAAGRALCGQGQHRHRRRAHHGGLPGLRAHRHRARHGGAPAARSRCAVDGQDEPGSVRHGPGRHALALWAACQRGRRGAGEWRLELGLGGGGGTGLGGLCAGHGHRRFRPHTGRVQRPGRAQAHAGACAHGWRAAGLPHARLRIGLCAHCGRRCPGAVRDRGRGRARRLQLARGRAGCGCAARAPGCARGAHLPRRRRV